MALYFFTQSSITNDLFQLSVDSRGVLLGLVGEGVMLVGLQVRVGPGAERLNSELHRGHRKLTCLRVVDTYNGF